MAKLKGEASKLQTHHDKIGKQFEDGLVDGFTDELLVWKIAMSEIEVSCSTFGIISYQTFTS